MERLYNMFAPKDIPLILGIRPNIIFIRDDFSWSFTTLRNYTVKSGYWRARDLSLLAFEPSAQGPSATKLLAQAWKIKTKKKLKHFVWQCIYGCLATCQMFLIDILEGTWNDQDVERPKKL